MQNGLSKWDPQENLSRINCEIGTWPDGQRVRARLALCPPDLFGIGLHMHEAIDKYRAG